MSLKDHFCLKTPIRINKETEILQEDDGVLVTDFGAKDKECAYERQC
jgi:hypothetical protein